MNARYTVVLKTLMDNPEASEKLSTALSTYPLYEPKTELKTLIPKRSELNQKLLNAYKYREIGFETVGRFLDELEITMNQIMPYYNELYKTIEIMSGLDNPFDNVDVTESYKETRKGTATNEATTSSNDEGSASTTSESHNTTSSTDNSSTNAAVNNSSKNVSSKTPSTELKITAENIDSVSYADDVNWNKSNNTDTATTTGTSKGSTDSDSEQTATSTNKSKTDSSGTQSTQDIIEHTFNKKGNQGVNTYAHDMNEFRTSIIDVTDQIINDDRISELFMRVF